MTLSGTSAGYPFPVPVVDDHENQLTYNSVQDTLDTIGLDESCGNTATEHKDCINVEYLTARWRLLGKCTVVLGLVITVVQQI